MGIKGGYTDWRLRGNCANLSGKAADKIFFSRGRRSNKAKAFCAGCPVTKECLLSATSHPGTLERGLWAGTSEKDRERIQGINGKRKQRAKRVLVNVTFT